MEATYEKCPGFLLLNQQLTLTEEETERQLQGLNKTMCQLEDKLDEVKQNIYDFKTDVKKDMSDFKSDVKQEIEDVRKGLFGEITNFKNDFPGILYEMLQKLLGKFFLWVILGAGGYALFMYLVKNFDSLYQRISTLLG